MDNSVEVWRRGNKKEIWECFCGFLDLSVPGFMRIQEELLMKQIGLLANCQLGREILGVPAPKSVDEFRTRVKLTRYGDYEHYLSMKREDVLPAKPHVWICTSGVGGKSKWVPLAEEAFDSMVKGIQAMLILSTSQGRDNFSLAPGDVVPNMVAPPPYSSGTVMKALAERYNLRLLPPFEDIMALKDMGERAALLFQSGLRHGMDVLVGFPTILIKIGEGFGEQWQKSMLASSHPKAGLRILRAIRKAKSEGREVLPKDVWDFKSIALSGIDVGTYRDKIIHDWGVDPFEVYINTEFSAPVACQTWSRKHMTPLVSDSFFEFIPEEEFLRNLDDPSYEPSTVLMDELSVGKRYELVFTNFHGGVFVRYRPGDMLKVVAPRDEEAGVQIPQFVVEGRADKLVDLAGFTRLDEKTIGRALEASGVRYEGWMARKEIEGDQAILRLYLATDQRRDCDAITEQIHLGLKQCDSSYEDLELILKVKPLRVTLLPWGTFEKYNRERIAAGSDPGQFKDQRANPPDWAIARIKALAGLQEA